MSQHKNAISAFNEFLVRHAGAFRSIARKAGADVSRDDLQQDAWLIATEIKAKRGHPIDFSDPKDQSTVLAWLTNKFLKYTSKKLSHAVWLDDDDSSISRTLAGSDDDNPLSQLVRYEQEVEAVERMPPLVKQSYSQASVYALLLTKFDGKKSAVAKLLGMTVETFRRKFLQENDWVSIQPSLFDGLIHVAIDFLPKPKAARHAVSRSLALHKEILAEQIPLDLPLFLVGHGKINFKY